MSLEKIILESVKSASPAILKKMKLIIEEFEHFSSHKLMPHLLSSYVKLNTSTSQLFRNKGYKINELYIPLTLKILDTEEVKVDKYPTDAIEKYNKIIIKDTAGMGKSTVLKMLFRYCFDGAKKVPIYIDLKSLIDEEKIIPVEVYIHKSFPSFTEKPSQDFINLLLQRAPFLFLFDGADEVPDKHKPKLFKEISDFQAKASNSAFIIATRDEDKILSSFNDFTSASIQPLKKNEAYLLLEKYQFEDVKASDLITEIEKPENASVLDFLKNPLLTTLLYTAYAYKKKVPLKKSLFFKQIYEALYENHDATKIGYLTREKKSGLDINSFEKILSHLAFYSRSKEKLEYSRPELFDILCKISEVHPTIEFDINGFIEDLTSRVPVLRKDGLSLAWQHKSIQEYFFSIYMIRTLKDEQKIEMLARLAQSNKLSKYKLVIDIIHDEDTELFHRTFTQAAYDFHMENVKDKYKGKSTENDSLNVFYRYISGDLKRIIGKGNYDRIHDKVNLATAEIFTEIKMLIQQKYDFKNYGVSQSYIQHHSKSFAYASILTSPIVTILEVLNSKKSDFVRNLSINGGGLIGGKLIENFTKEGNVSALRSLGINFNIYVIDAETCRTFLEKLNSDVKKREESTMFFTDF